MIYNILFSNLFISYEEKQLETLERLLDIQIPQGPDSFRGLSLAPTGRNIEKEVFSKLVKNIKHVSPFLYPLLTVMISEETPLLVCLIYHGKITALCSDEGKPSITFKSN